MSYGFETKVSGWSKWNFWSVYSFLNSHTQRSSEKPAVIPSGSMQWNIQIRKPCTLSGCHILNAFGVLWRRKLCEEWKIELGEVFNTACFLTCPVKWTCFWVCWFQEVATSVLMSGECGRGMNTWINMLPPFWVLCIFLSHYYQVSNHLWKQFHYITYYMLLLYTMLSPVTRLGLVICEIWQMPDRPAHLVSIEKFWVMGRFPVRPCLSQTHDVFAFCRLKNQNVCISFWLHLSWI